ncbi:MAG TPA: TolC family protein [Sediminibacterium sp.]|uniref:TolC family protein n=1 Tax=Sediminibacterium sp. TaxID=1917865 RepID=UPI000AD3BF9A|nr:TolC family protein [Sediminibacterium sp.]HLD52464.1 TolC family protein [Sediminibacterium sp.]
MRKLIFFLGLSLQITAYAQSFTLPVIESLAIQNYPLIKQSDLLNKTAQLSVENIQRALYPQITINGQASYQTDVTSIQIPIPGFSPSALSKDQYRATVDVQQNIYDGGINKTMTQIVQAGNKVALLKNEVNIYQLKERVTQLYCSILYTQSVIGQIELINTDLSQALSKVETLHKNGLVFNNNVLQIKAQILKNQQKLTEVIASKKIVLDALGLLTNTTFQLSTPFEMPNTILAADNQPEYERPEFRLFDAQKNNIQSQLALVDAKNNPKISAFLQTGYGRPALNMLKNDFALFGIGGIRLQWSLGNFYTAKREKTILQNQTLLVQNEKETYSLNYRIELQKYLDEIEKLNSLIVADKELIELRNQIKNTSLVQLNNGVITANDYLNEVNEYDQAKQLLIQHQTQVVQSKLQYHLTKGKSN